MDNEQLEELRKKIIDGLNLSAKLLLEKKRKENGKLVISKDGVIMVVDAKEIVD